MSHGEIFTLIFGLEYKTMID